MDAKDVVDSFLTILNDVKSNLDVLCDSVSPFTGNKRVIQNGTAKMCLDTGYRFDSDPSFKAQMETSPDYIKSTSTVDADGNEWFYSLMGDENFMVMPVKFSDTNPKEVEIWSLAALKLLIYPTDEEMVGAVMLSDGWYSCKSTYFAEFVEAFVAYNIIGKTYSTPENVN